MSLVVYAPDFSNRNEISHAISIQMSEYYNGIGKITLDVPISDHNIHVLKIGCIVYDTYRKSAYIVKNVKTVTSENKITAHGYTTNQILNERVVSSPTAIDSVESGVYSMVNENIRGMTKLVTAQNKGLAEHFQITVYGGSVLDEIMEVLSAVGLGQRMLWDYKNNQHVFEIYKGIDLTEGLHAVVFSDERGTAHNIVIDDDESDYKNVIYVVSKFNESMLVEVVGDAAGDNRKEKWFEVSLNAESGETEKSFRERMRVQGAMELGKMLRRQSFSVSIDPLEFGTAYNLGDIVSCVSKRFGVKFNARVNGVKYRKDSRFENTEIILGEPKLMLIGGVKLA